MKKTIFFSASLALAATAVAIGLSSDELRLPDGTLRKAEVSVAKETTFPAFSEATINYGVGPQESVARADEGVQELDPKFLPYSDKYNYDVSDGHINFFAYGVRAQSSWQNRVTLHTSENLDWPSGLASWPYGSQEAGWASGEKMPISGTMVGDKYYVYCVENWALSLIWYNLGLYEVDTRTGELGQQVWAEGSDNNGQYNNNRSPVDICYDPKTSAIYLAYQTCSGTGLDTEILVPCDIYKIPVKDGKPNGVRQKLGTINNKIRGLAAYDGRLYILTTDFSEALPFCVLRYVDLNENSSVNDSDLKYAGAEDKKGKINDGFLQINYMQSMSFDLTDGTLWWFGAENNTGKVFITKFKRGEDGWPTYETDKRVEAGEVVTWSSMGIPYQQNVDKEAPSHLRNINYLPGADGKGEVTFRFQLPKKTAWGKDLDKSKIKELIIKRNGEKYKTLSLSEIEKLEQWDPSSEPEEEVPNMGEIIGGEPEEEVVEETDNAPYYTWKDESVPNGTHAYTFQIIGTDGKEGIIKQRNIFIGKDVPSAAHSVVLKETSESDKIEVSWTAPGNGIHRGWIDKSTLKYDVTRYPDKKQVATDLTDTKFTDTSDKYGSYYYEITPKNAQGTGPKVTSKKIPFGPKVKVPYQNNFDTEEEGDMLYYLDNNMDGETLHWGVTVKEQGDINVSYFTNNGQPCNEWFFTPPFELDNSKKYMFRLHYCVGRQTQGTYKVNIYQGTDRNTTNHKKNKLLTFTDNKESQEKTQEVTIVDIDPSKGNIISFELEDDGQGWIVVEDIHIREYSDKDVSVRELTVPSLVFDGGDNKLSISVRNEGSTNVRGATVQLVKYPQMSMLAEAKVDALGVGAFKDVELKWHPTELGDYNVTAKITLEGDTYEADNTLSGYTPLQVQSGVPMDWKRVQTPGNHSFEPFYTLMGRSHYQSIYTQEEIGMEDITITGITYMYRTPADQDDRMNAVPVVIKVGQTDKETVQNVQLDQPNSYSETGTLQRCDSFDKYLDEKGWTEVFNKTVNMNGQQKPYNDLTMIFHPAIYYPGDKNLVISALTDVSTYYDANASFRTEHYDAWALNGRGLDREYWVSVKNIVSSYGPDWFIPTGSIPVVMLGYAPGDCVDLYSQTGIEEVGYITLNAPIRIEGRTIILEQTQERIELYDIDGKLVNIVEGSDRIEAPATGIYAVRGYNGADRCHAKAYVAD